MRTQVCGALALSMLATSAALVGGPSANGSVAPVHRESPAEHAHPTLNGISAVSPDDVWAVGNFEDGQRQVTLVKHFDGTRWQRVASPSPGGRYGGGLGDVSADSATDAWAVGSYETASPQLKSLILHWDGITWTRVRSPNPPQLQRFDYLGGVSAVSATDAWIVGNNGLRPLALHWDGTRWHHVDVPNPGGADGGTLQSVSAVSSHDVWAVGSFSAARGRTVVEHWDGTAWSIVASPTPPNAQYVDLWSVSAVSADDVWAAGDYGGSDSQRTLLEHWDGSSWSRVPSPPLGRSPYGGLYGISGFSWDDAWAVGYAGDRGLILHWDGTAWSPAELPNPRSAYLSRVSIDARGDAWASGSHSAGGGQTYQTLVEHWDGHAWTRS